MARELEKTKLADTLSKLQQPYAPEQRLILRSQEKPENNNSACGEREGEENENEKLGGLGYRSISSSSAEFRGSQYRNLVSNDAKSSLQRMTHSAPVYYCANPHLIECASAAVVKKEGIVEVATEAPLAVGTALKKIKLLKIVPYDDRDDACTTYLPVRCSLQTFDWEASPEYIALSYVWGTESPKNPIIVNGKREVVRSNLHSALAHFASEKLSAYFWADAICINQTDEEEKSIVVQHMGEIFKRATKVFAWLGPLEDAGAVQSSGTSARRGWDLVDSLEHLGSVFWDNAGAGDRKLSEASFDLPLVFQRCLPVLQQIFSVGDSGNCFPVSAYANFSNRLYWQRIWVLQEVYLARDLWFYCGPKRISRRTLSGALILLQRFQKHIVSTIDITTLNTANPLRRFAFDSSSFPEMHRLIIYTSIYPSHIISLRVAMANFCVKELPRASRATDPRDMIFGLLGFATPRETGYIKADYSKPVRETYRDVTRAMIANGFADIMAWSQHGVKRIQGLASWVPDFSATIYEPMCSQGQAKPWLPRFDAAAGRAVTFWPGLKEQEGSDTLSLLGVTLDEISEVGTLWAPREASASAGEGFLHDATMPTRSASYEAIFTILREIQHFARRSSVHAEGGAVFRVACADQLVLDSKLCRAPGDLASYYDRVLDAVRAYLFGGSKEGIQSDARPYIETMLRWVEKRPFLTPGGYVGLAPGEARKGDFIVILHGFSAPFVLRKIEGRGKRRYEVVGESYVCGVMDGEGLDGLEGVEDLFCLV